MINSCDGKEKEENRAIVLMKIMRIILQLNCVIWKYSKKKLTTNTSLFIHDNLTHTEIV